MMEEVELWFTLNNNQTGSTSDNQRVEVCDKWSVHAEGSLKCNIHANWRNSYLHSGVAWITRDHQGNVVHHARDAITFAPNRLVAELRCVIWALLSLRDLGITKVVLALDYQEVVAALKAPHHWPKFRGLLERVRELSGSFESLVFEGEKISANGVARDIGGPSWLQDRILRETNGNGY